MKRKRYGMTSLALAAATQSLMSKRRNKRTNIVADKIKFICKMLSIAVERLRFGLVGLLLIWGIASGFIPVKVLAAPSDAENGLNHLQIKALNGNSYMANDFYEEYIVFFFGRSGCFNTRKMLNTAIDCRNKGSSVKIILMDVDVEDAGLSALADELKILASMNSPYNNNQMWIIGRQAEIVDGERVNFPGTFILDANRNLIYSNFGLDTVGIKKILLFGKKECTSGEHNYVYQGTNDGVAKMVCDKCEDTYSITTATSITIYERLNTESGEYWLDLSNYGDSENVLSKDGEVLLGYDFYPADADDVTVEVIVDNPRVLVHDPFGGKLTPVGFGTTKVTFRLKYNPTVQQVLTFTVREKAQDNNNNNYNNNKTNVDTSTLDCHWYSESGKNYWYERGIRQGTYNDPKGVVGDGTVRGREIYDPASDGWYWLDSCYDGAKAVGKEVWMPYIYQNEKNWGDAEIRSNANASDTGMQEQTYRAIKAKKGKWVRYDENGKMLKGWVTISGALAELYPKQIGNTYYYDHKTGLMAKGWTVIDGRKYYFDEITGALK